MKEYDYRSSVVCQNEKLAKGICKLTLSTDECKFEQPGQCAIVVIDGIARPFQVCDFDSNRFSIVVDTDTEVGTKLSAMEYGQELMTATGLGNGFDLDAIPDDSYLVADSVGIPEILVLARNLLTRGIHFKVVLGYPTKSEMFMVEAFRNICSELEILTADGSNGREGSASDVNIKTKYICASGTSNMLKAMSAKAEDGQFSFSNLLISDEGILNAKVTGSAGSEINVKDGPVFRKSEISWNLI